MPAAELLDWLAAQGSEDAPRNPEKEVQWLLQALAERPDDTALREVAASALQACSADDEAIDLLWEYVERHTDEEQQLAYYLLNALLARGEYDQVKRLGRLYADSVPLIALWSEVKLAEKLNDWPELERACQSVLEISPGSLGAHSLLGKALMEQDRFAEAALAYQRLAGKLEEPQSVQWDQMTAASAARDWTMLREVAAGMGMEFAAGDGPIEEDWGWVIVRYIEDGEALDYYARRTGPVTARVLENAPGNRSQRVGDWVVFDAGLIYPAPKTRRNASVSFPPMRWCTSSRAVVTRRAGWWTASIRATRPSTPSAKRSTRAAGRSGCTATATTRSPMPAAARNCGRSTSPSRHPRSRRRATCTRRCRRPPGNGRTACAGCAWRKRRRSTPSRTWTLSSATACSRYASA